MISDLERIFFHYAVKVTVFPTVSVKFDGNCSNPPEPVQAALEELDLGAFNVSLQKIDLAKPGFLYDLVDSYSLDCP
jgi:hypothetical protein